jgi:ribonucleotide monophosphatase NagD (HAD superfamily)
MKKLNLIFPVAGEAVRFGGTFKPFLNIGDKTFIEVTYQPFLKWKDQIDTVYFICTQEQEDVYNVTLKITKLIDHPHVEVVKIPSKTIGPYQTVRQAITLANISGKSIICDCDHTLNVDNLFTYKLDYDVLIPTWPISEDEWMNWSKVVHDGNNIQMICEKERIISDDLFVDGIIGCIVFDKIENKFQSKNHIYISNCLHALLQSGKILKTTSVSYANFYGDVQMLESYVNILRKQCTVFCDIDGVLIKHNTHSNQDVSDNKLLSGYNKLQEWSSQGHKIILTTARSEKNRKELINLLNELGIKYDELVMELPAGPRLLINDHKPSKPFTNQATAIEVTRDEGLLTKEINDVVMSNDVEIIKQFEGGSFAKTYLVKLNDKLFVRKHIIKTLDDIIHYDKLVRQMRDLQRLNFLWPGCTPNIIYNKDTDYDFRFDMEYLSNYNTLSECEESNQIIALNELFKGMKNNIYSMKQDVDGISWLNNHLDKKIYTKFENYRKHPILKTLIDSEEVIINGKLYKGLNSLLDIVDKHMLKPTSIRPIHGDFTFENVMWDGKNIKLIDMDGSDEFDAAELDLGKMCQSVLSRFNEWKNLTNVVTDMTGNSFKCVNEYFEYDHDNIHKLVFKKWTQILNNNYNVTKNKGIFYMCMYFIRFVPFRLKQSEEHGIFALIMAIVWLSKIKETNE